MSFKQREASMPMQGKALAVSEQLIPAGGDFGSLGPSSQIEFHVEGYTFSQLSLSTSYSAELK